MKFQSKYIVFIFAAVFIAAVAFAIAMNFTLPEESAESETEGVMRTPVSSETDSNTESENLTELTEETEDTIESITETELEETEQSSEESSEEPATVIEGDRDIPILMYHTSSESSPGGLAELYVKPSEFALQLKTLKEKGYTFCTFDDFDRVNAIEKPVLLTFDDGYLENYTEIFPLLKEYDAKITLFLILSSITVSNLTEEMIKEMSDSGLVKFESHTLTHPSLSVISPNAARLESEISTSKEKIEAVTGKEVVALSYPNGEFNDAVKECAAKYYRFGVRKDLGMHNTSYDNFEVRRIRINRSTTIGNYLTLIGEN